jgi:hypothetical protein
MDLPDGAVIVDFQTTPDGGCVVEYRLPKRFSPDEFLPQVYRGRQSTPMRTYGAIPITVRHPSNSEALYETYVAAEWLTKRWTDLGFRVVAKGEPIPRPGR